jgi:spore coat polysaccharide biosynthesis predicted glycosyltransferase SpsG
VRRASLWSGGITARGAATVPGDALEQVQRDLGGGRMNGMRVVLVTEGGADVGLGHVSRCLAIARAAVAAGARATFVAAPEPRVEALIGALPAPVVALPWTTEPAAALAALRDLTPDAIVVDSYKATPDFLRALGGLGAPVVAVDDTAERALPVDAVVNGSIAAETLPYRRTADTAWLLGPRYAPLDPAYAGLPERPARARVDRVLVTLGGGLNTADVVAVVRAADAVLRDATVDVAVGSFAADAPELDAAVRASANRVVVHRDRFGLCDMMLAADLAVCGAGMTLYELAAAGTPAITVCIADNQRPNAEAFARAGAAPAGGWSRDPGLAAGVAQSLRTLLDAPARADVARRAHRLVDGRGAERVVQWMLDAVPARRCS